MVGCTRPYDTVGRYGGEEFLVVVPSSGVLGPFGLAERMRKALESQPFLADASEVRITGSFGVAVCSEENPHDSEELLRLADDALYRAKGQRNRSELANPTHSSARVRPSPLRTRLVEAGRVERLGMRCVGEDGRNKANRHRIPLISLP